MSGKTNLKKLMEDRDKNIIKKGFEATKGDQFKPTKKKQYFNQRSQDVRYK